MCSVPSKVRLPSLSSRAVSIGCGDEHTLVQLDTGVICTFGNPMHGRLGTGGDFDGRGGWRIEMSRLDKVSLDLFDREKYRCAQRPKSTTADAIEAKYGKSPRRLKFSAMSGEAADSHCGDNTLA